MAAHYLSDERCRRSVSTPVMLLALCLVCPGLSSAAELRDEIDTRIRDAWTQQNIPQPPLASDGEFLRRVWLDLTGSIPTYDETVAFLDDTAANKRSRLIDRLLDDPRYAAHQMQVWDMIYFGRNPPGNEARQRDGFRKWLQQQFAGNTPYDQIASQLLKAPGNTVDNGAPMFLVQYDRKPEDAAEAITETFLGVQLQCARCHDHPYEAWTQQDFYGVAAFLARLELVQVGKAGRDKKLVIGEKNLGDVLFTGPASEQTPGKKGTPISARFLSGEPLEEPELPEDFEEPRRFPSGKQPPAPKFSRKDHLADWITRPENPWFARATANRVWAQFMGRGLIHPVENLSPSNPPSHPELLTSLTEALISHGFDLKWYIREICNSQAYQVSSTGEAIEERPLWFERARNRPLSAEELINAWRIATRYDVVYRKSGKKMDDTFYGVTSGYMLSFFGRPSNGTGDFQGGLHEHLYLNNGQIHTLISTREGSLHHWLQGEGVDEAERVNRLYLSILNRRPTEKERTFFATFLAGDDPDGRLRDAIWALLTSSEFRFNH